MPDFTRRVHGPELDLARVSDARAGHTTEGTFTWHTKWPCWNKPGSWSAQRLELLSQIRGWKVVRPAPLSWKSPADHRALSLQSEATGLCTPPPKARQGSFKCLMVNTRCKCCRSHGLSQKENTCNHAINHWLEVLTTTIGSIPGLSSGEQLKRRGGMQIELTAAFSSEKIARVTELMLVIKVHGVNICTGLVYFPEALYLIMP